MHESTIREIVDSGATAAGALAKEVLVHRKEMDRIEAEKKAQIELVEARKRAQDDTEDTDDDETRLERPGTPQPTADEIEAEIEELMAEEMCAICRELLRALKDRPPAEQIRGVKEYGEFKNRLSSDADAEELRAVLRETVVLHSIFEENLNGMV